MSLLRTQAGLGALMEQQALTSSRLQLVVSLLSLYMKKRMALEWG